MLIILLIITMVLGVYVSLRYISLRCACKNIQEELDDLRKDLTQNQILHLPLPDKQLGKLLSSFNDTLEDIRKERISYQKREQELQHQIEHISHDLRTPLTVILGYLKLMQKQEQIQRDRELSETLSIVEQKAEQMNVLVAQFYDYSRFHGDDFKLDLHPVDLSRLIRESLLGHYQLLEQSSLAVEADVPDYPLEVIGEEAAWERIIQNLLQNAARYASSYLQISFEEEGDEVVVSFQNDTDQLLEEDLAHLFERFYMQDASRTQGGTGLGLTVAKTLAEQMHAQLSVHKVEEPAGTDMTICFEIRMKKA